jgi:putative endonuclease
MQREFYVYIMTNAANKVLYTGVTNNLAKRISEHKAGMGGKFTSKYKISKLVYYETSGDITSAISREKQIKAGSRKKKIQLIESMNPTWNDLSFV